MTTNTKDSNSSEQYVLVDRVKSILKNTDTSSWKRGGGPLRPEDRHDKPRETWEWIYTIEIPSGVLACRASTPVKSEFAGRGFALIPIARANFSVELRPKGWHHSELTDPYKRAKSAEKTFTLMAEGAIAEEIFIHIAKALETHHGSQHRDLEQKAEKVVDKILKEEEESGLMWDSIPGDPAISHYRTFFEDLVLDVYQTTDAGGNSRYAMSVSRDDYVIKVKNTSAIAAIYKNILEFGQTSRLLELTKALEEI